MQDAGTFPAHRIAAAVALHLIRVAHGGQAPRSIYHRLCARERQLLSDRSCVFNRPSLARCHGVLRWSVGNIPRTDKGRRLENDGTKGTSAQVRYETPAPHVARIVMARPEAHNAQGLQMTYELNAAFDHAARDDRSK